MSKPVVVVLSVAAAITGALAAHAAPPRGARAAAEADRRGADVVPDAPLRRLSRAAKKAPLAAGTAAAVTVEDVGDVDSFGRTLRWLGVANAFLTLADACDPADPAPCQVLAPSPAPTAFNFTDTVRIALPAKASHSILCYWFSPVLTVSCRNATAAPVIARLTYNPTLTVENPVLDDPALIDPPPACRSAGG